MAVDALAPWVTRLSKAVALAVLDTQVLVEFLHLAHLYHRVLLCPAPSVCPSIPPLLPLHIPQYSTDPLHVWYSLSCSFHVHFVGSSGTLIFYEYIGWLASWTRPPRDPILRIIFLLSATSKLNKPRKCNKVLYFMNYIKHDRAYLIVA